MKKLAGLQTVSEAMELVKKNYYFYDDDTQENMVVGAVKGLAANMGDDYAEYYTKDEYDALLNSNSGNFIGMGVLVSDKGDSTFIITEVYENTPAREAGILVGDQLIYANGEPATGKTLDEFLGYITHEEGDVNTVVILRDGQELTFTVTMRQVYSPYVTYKMLDDSIGYIYISGFHGQVVREVKDALKDLKEQGMEALVLDVRDDLGGSLSDVCDIADIFLPKNAVITTVKSRINEETVYRTHSDGLDLPIAMLVNGYSASASELLSGALKDNGVAELFGTVTYGKGIVQTFFDINFGRDGTIKFTTDAYYTPSGVCIQGTGITPDHVVELPEGLTYYNIPSIPYESDTQLQAAVAYLQGLDQ
ncbi:MAG: PDZ domain-containing protein [Clostridia bacterium]|nr:PDZ domain-containing protein [Clostridia bacterium]